MTPFLVLWQQARVGSSLMPPGCHLVGRMAAACGRARADACCRGRRPGTTPTCMLFMWARVLRFGVCGEPALLHGPCQTGRLLLNSSMYRALTAGVEVEVGSLLLVVPRC